MKTSPVLSALILVLALLAAAPVRAFDQGGARFKEAADRIGLTADQRNAVSDLVYKADTAKVDIQARLSRAEIEMRHQFGKAKLDEAAVHKALDALVAAEAEMKRNRVLLVVALRRVLSLEQWEQLEKFRQEQGMGNPGGPGGRPGMHGPRGGPWQPDRPPVPPPTPAP